MPIEQPAEHADRLSTSPLGDRSGSHGTFIRGIHRAE